MGALHYGSPGINFGCYCIIIYVLFPGNGKKWPQQPLLLSVHGHVVQQHGTRSTESLSSIDVHAPSSWRGELNFDAFFLAFLHHSLNSLVNLVAGTCISPPPEVGKSRIYMRTRCQVRETRRAVRDSSRGVEKMAIGHHIRDRAHVIERKRDTRTGEQEENQELINLDDGEFRNIFFLLQDTTCSFLGRARL